MKGIFKPIDYRTHEQNTSHIHYGKAVTILEKDILGYCFSIDDFPNCNHREKQNRFHAGYEEIEIIDHPTEKGETERQIQTAKTMIEKMVSCYDKTEKGGAE